MNRLKEKYQNEALPKLQEEFNLKNKMEAPKVEKIVISIGLGEAKDNQGILDKVKTYLTALSGQAPVINKAKKSISAFKVAEGQNVGIMVTLRGEKMYAFLDKLMNIVMPKIRDFKGIPEKSFDGNGNLNIGLKEQTIFPEVDYKTVDKTRGMAVTIVTTATDVKQGKQLLALLGMPFRS